MSENFENYQSEESHVPVLTPEPVLEPTSEPPGDRGKGNKSRKLKNIIMIAIIVVMGVCMGFTMNLAKNGTFLSTGGSGGMQNMQQMPGGGGGGGNDSQQISSDSSDSSGSDSSSDSSSDKKQGNMQPPGGSSDQNGGGQPPDMQGQSNSSKDGNSSDSGSSDSSDQNNGGGMQMPGGTSDQNGGGMQMPGGTSDQNGGGMQMSGGGGQGGMQMPGNGNETSLTAIYYVLFGVESLIMALIIAYLILSKMNLYTRRETFCRTGVVTRDKVLVFVLVTILLGGCLTQADVLITNHAFLAGSSATMQDAPGSNGQDGNGSGQEASDSNTANATGAKEVDGTEETLNGEYTSSTADENAVLVKNGGTLTSNGATIDKKAGDSSNTESSDFSGVNSGVLVASGSTAKIKNATISTSAKGANAVFATGSGSSIKISDSTIRTTGEGSSRGLDATYGGKITASNVEITTEGGSCATLATDRGEGTVSADQSTLETNGTGSPIIYSTGKITLTNSTGTANDSQICVVEGKNSATIKDSEVTCSGTGNRGDVDIAGVMIYQSMSGDASEGTGSFTAKDSTLTIDENSKYSKTAPMFFITNTDAKINLTNTKLSYHSGVLINAKGTDQWGTSGSNGGNVTLKAVSQDLEGDINVDDISTLNMTLKEESSYKGTINGDNTAKSITLKLSRDSSIKLTGDSYVTKLSDADSDYSNIDLNGHTLYVNGKALEK